MKCTLVRVDNGQPFIPEGEPIQNADGSMSCRLPSGAWGGQEPPYWDGHQLVNYGVRHPDQPGDQVPGAYQRFTVSGSVAVFVTRPQDPPAAYLYAVGRAY
jgi:hypothetical protein